MPNPIDEILIIQVGCRYVTNPHWGKNRNLGRNGFKSVLGARVFLSIQKSSWQKSSRLENKGVSNG